MKIYEELIIEILYIETKDILTTSPGDGGFNSESDEEWNW